MKEDIGKSTITATGFAIEDYSLVLVKVVNK